jgi:hypothetical protein
VEIPIGGVMLLTLGLMCSRSTTVIAGQLLIRPPKTFGGWL